MLYQLTRIIIEWFLWAVGIVDTTKRKLAQDYPALHGKD
jgi:hypothetical protein